MSINSNVTLISTAKNWLEQTAIDQLNQVSTLPGVVKVVGLPDLHPGKTPVGATVITEEIIYPHLIGNDIGCGMSMFLTDLETRKIKIDKLVKKAENILDLKTIPLPESIGMDTDLPFAESIGTIGGGNHFAELQTTASVLDNEVFKKLGFDKDQVMLLVHSGSRGYGQMILEESIRLHHAQKGLPPASEAFKWYLAQHDAVTNWATLNRELIAYRLLKAMGVNPFATKLIDCFHNIIRIQQSGNNPLYFHHKGAACTMQEAVIIPGSRGSLTYLVIPTAKIELSGYSLAHGAGRKWERGKCKSRLETRYNKESIKTTKLKGRVICNDPNLLFEEAPEAYKNIDAVIQSLVDFELIEIIATFKPILTYKN
ncbi:MAG TPA: RNA ligase RtcB family protein [Bacillota bacterium]|nr:RNA ligase RtcB family protein [Bacillota bacterium]HOL11211.1 RNA ligase RtcB family protein [Bacillota bacterium]HPO98928.1 RNA ligase RtcB family protein [Bacillota bacterium]